MLLFETYYHIFNHANGTDNLFREDKNYYYFLQQWSKYIEPIADTYAYCLMPNHFHFLIKTKSVRDLTGFGNLSGLHADQSPSVLTKQFSNLFNAYAKAYNKEYKRKGSLFMRPFKAKEITTDNYLTAIVCYIHTNPVQHGFCKNYKDWKFSSYCAYLSNVPSKIKKEETLNWFGSVDNFIKSHSPKI